MPASRAGWPQPGPGNVIGAHVNSDRGALGMVGEQLPLPDDLTAGEQAVVERAQAAWKEERSGWAQARRRGQGWPEATRRAWP
ncbi:hypothetical protein [Amycolatopsis plumensis]|uniref:hypothetical protein n=1 Tax=Amycolatopsis plumensis TaxID=236508 RepID=UPI00361E8840